MATQSPDSPLSESSRATSSAGTPRSSEKLEFLPRADIGAMTIGDMYQHGLDLYREKKFEDAVRVFTAIVAEDGENYESYQARGQCYLELQNYSKAVTDLRRATEMHPGALQDHQRAVAHYYAHLYANLELALPTDSSLAPAGLETLTMDAWKYYNRALSAYYLSEYENSIADFSKVLDRAPTFAAGYRCRGTAYLHLGSFEKAIEDLLQSSKLERCSTTFYNLGLAYGNLQQFESAVKYFTQAIALNPNDAASFSNRGISYKALRQFENAVADFSTALTLNAESASSYDHRAQCHSELGAHANALEDYDKSLNISAPTSARYHRRAATYFALSNVDYAVKDIDAAIALVSTTLKRQANPAVPLPAVQLAQAQQSHLLLGSYYFTRAKYLLDSNVAQAEEDLGKSLAHAPRDSDALYLRSVARNLLKDTIGAMKDLKEASKIDGTFQMQQSLSAAFFPF